MAGVVDCTVTTNQVVHTKNLGDHHRLALVEVSPGAATEDWVRYVVHAFDDTDTDDFTATKNVMDWKKDWDLGEGPR